ncbi:hypothetical protein HDV05_002462, partial [Chytridiales sp. JEL 0842]
KMGGYHKLVRQRLWDFLCHICLTRLEGNRQKSNVILTTHLTESGNPTRACPTCRTALVKKYPERALEGVDLNYFDEWVNKGIAMKKYSLPRWALNGIRHKLIFMRACEFHGGLEGMRQCGIYIPLNGPAAQVKHADDEEVEQVECGSQSASAESGESADLEAVVPHLQL